MSFSIFHFSVKRLNVAKIFILSKFLFEILCPYPSVFAEDRSISGDIGNKGQESEQVRSLSVSEQAQLLSSRINSDFRFFYKQEYQREGFIRFGFFVSLAYASTANEKQTVIISADTPSYNDVEIEMPFPSSYVPTWRELFNTVARQTKTTWSYIDSRWTFHQPAQKTPWKILKPKGWKEESRGLYTAYIPELQPVGMDIYDMGQYSTTDNKDMPALIKDIRERIALNSARKISQSAKIDAMVSDSLAGLEALSWEWSANEEGRKLTWRQWVIIKGNQAILIVSVLEKKNEGKLWPEIEGMLRSLSID